VDQGDDVHVWTTVADELTAFWSPAGRCFPSGTEADCGVEVRRYPVTGRVRGRRWLLKPLSMVPMRLWQCLALPCNPVSFAMWQAAGRSTDRYDAIHATAFPYAWPIACGLRLARRLRVPFLLTPFLHLGDPADPGDRTRRQYTAGPFRWLLRAADRVFVQTTGEYDAVLDLGVSPRRVVRQGLGVDPASCTGGDRRRARQLWGVANDTVVIGHLANNSVEKGTVDLLRAAEQLRLRGVDLEVVLAGPEMPNFREFITGCSFANRVRRLGVLSDGERRDFFAGIDLFALPSRSDSFGLVLLEAWANGLPNVVYRAGGPADVVRHGIDGWQTPCGDIDDLAKRLSQLVSDAGMRRAFGEAGRERICREFRWDDKLELVRNTLQEFSRDAESAEWSAHVTALRSAKPPRRG
jgi:glycosyltransferase involved in cell wall biosynthesis